MKPIVEAIRERGGDYFLFVKGNQPELQAELARAFVVPEARFQHVPEARFQHDDVSPSGDCRRRAHQGRRAA